MRDVRRSIDKLTRCHKSCIPLKYFVVFEIVLDTKEHVLRLILLLHKNTFSVQILHYVHAMLIKGGFL